MYIQRTTGIFFIYIVVIKESVMVWQCHLLSSFPFPGQNLKSCSIFASSICPRNIFTASRWIISRPFPPWLSLSLKNVRISSWIHSWKFHGQSPPHICPCCMSYTSTVFWSPQLQIQENATDATDVGSLPTLFSCYVHNYLLYFYHKQNNFVYMASSTLPPVLFSKNVPSVLSPSNVSTLE